MANPQKENGFTAIANEILEQTMRYKFNATQLKIIMTVWRYTYGFQRKEHGLSLTFIANAISSNKNVVKKELDFLIENKIIFITKEAGFNSSRKVKFNKNYNEWGTPTDVLSINNSTVHQEVDTQYTNRSTQQYTNRSTKKEINKENIKEKYNSIFEEFLSQQIIKHQSITKVMKESIDKALKRYSQEEIIKAIKRYGEAYRDTTYEFCNYRMTLDKFLTQKNGLYDWLDEGQKWINYSNFKNKTKTLEKDDVYNVNGR